MLELYDPTVHAPLAGRWGHDARAAALDYLTHILWLLGLSRSGLPSDGRRVRDLAADKPLRQHRPDPLFCRRPLRGFAARSDRAATPLGCDGRLRSRARIFLGQEPRFSKACRYSNTVGKPMASRLQNKALARMSTVAEKDERIFSVDWPRHLLRWDGRQSLADDCRGSVGVRTHCGALLGRRVASHCWRHSACEGR